VLTLVALSLTAATSFLGVAACGSPKYHYVKSTTERTFVRVPRDWTLFDEDQLLTSSDESAEGRAELKRLTWRVAFDAAPRPSADHILSVSDHPTGLVLVHNLLPEQRDRFSLSDLRSVLLRFDPLEDQQDLDVEVLASREVERPGGLHGNELLLNLRTADGKVLKWRQIALVDAALRKIHVLAISCEADCYDGNERVINQVIASWKVKER
jgi:hypothetical protein